MHHLISPFYVISITTPSFSQDFQPSRHILKMPSLTIMTKSPSQHHRGDRTTIPLYSPKLSLYILATCVLLLILFQIKCLQTPPPPVSSSPPSFHLQINHSDIEKLRDSVTFLPLKDLRYATTALQGHTWFMSSTYDTQEDGGVQHQYYPSQSSKGRLLCLKAKDTHDGALNSYAFAWPEALPHNAELMKGLTFISYNHYNYDNIWHGLCAVYPFVAWHVMNRRCEMPDRWILFHWGELRFTMNNWLKTLLNATFNGSVNIEKFDEISDNEIPVCMERAVVMRHNEGGMSRVKRMEAYDLMRCKAREYCNVTNNNSDKPLIGLTMLMRTGPRSFKNESIVIDIFEKECAKFDGCKLNVAYSNNLTFCEQVKLMSTTDILVSPHGAQLTNMFFMDRNSSVMEFFPKGWLKLAGVGQFVLRWLASWSGMRHQGAWRDPDGEFCPYSDDDPRCMSIFKMGKIGHNETHFSQWTKNVLCEMKQLKMEQAFSNKSIGPKSIGCACG